MAPTLSTRSNESVERKSAASWRCSARRVWTPSRLRGLARLSKGVLGDVDPLGVQLRVRGQGAQKPFPAAAAQVEYPLVATWGAMFQQLSHRVVVEWRLDRVVGMGEPGDLFTIHRRSLTAPELPRTSISSADWTSVRQPSVHRY